jgi:hypothetical protein
LAHFGRQSICHGIRSRTIRKEERLKEDNAAYDERRLDQEEKKKMNMKLEEVKLRLWTNLQQ